MFGRFSRIFSQGGGSSRAVRSLARASSRRLPHVVTGGGSFAATFHLARAVVPTRSNDTFDLIESAPLESHELGSGYEIPRDNNFTSEHISSTFAPHPVSSSLSIDHLPTFQKQQQQQQEQPTSEDSPNQHATLQDMFRLEHARRTAEALRSGQPPPAPLPVALGGSLQPMDFAGNLSPEAVDVTNRSSVHKSALQSRSPLQRIAEVSHQGGSLTDSLASWVNARQAEQMDPSLSSSRASSKTQAEISQARTQDNSQNDGIQSIFQSLLPSTVISLDPDKNAFLASSRAGELAQPDGYVVESEEDVEKLRAQLLSNMPLARRSSLDEQTAPQFTPEDILESNKILQLLSEGKIDKDSIPPEQLESPAYQQALFAYSLQKYDQDRQMEQSRQMLTSKAQLMLESGLFEAQKLGLFVKYRTWEDIMTPRVPALEPALCSKEEFAHLLNTIDPDNITYGDILTMNTVYRHFERWLTILHSHPEIIDLIEEVKLDMDIKAVVDSQLKAYKRVFDELRASIEDDVLAQSQNDAHIASYLGTGMAGTNNKITNLPVSQSVFSVFIDTVQKQFQPNAGIEETALHQLVAEKDKEFHQFRDHALEQSRQKLCDDVLLQHAITRRELLLKKQQVLEDKYNRSTGVGRTSPGMLLLSDEDQELLRDAETTMRNYIQKHGDSPNQVDMLLAAQTLERLGDPAELMTLPSSKIDVDRISSTSLQQQLNTELAASFSAPSSMDQIRKIVGQFNTAQKNILAFATSLENYPGASPLSVEIDIEALQAAAASTSPEQLKEDFGISQTELFEALQEFQSGLNKSTKQKVGTSSDKDYDNDDNDDDNDDDDDADDDEQGDWYSSVATKTKANKLLPRTPTGPVFDAFVESLFEDTKKNRTLSPEEQEAEKVYNETKQLEKKLRRNIRRQQKRRAREQKKPQLDPNLLFDNQQDGPQPLSMSTTSALNDTGDTSKIDVTIPGKKTVRLQRMLDPETKRFRYFCANPADAKLAYIHLATAGARRRRLTDLRSLVTARQLMDSQKDIKAHIESMQQEIDAKLDDMRENGATEEEILRQRAKLSTRIDDFNAELHRRYFKHIDVDHMILAEQFTQEEMNQKLRDLRQLEAEFSTTAQQKFVEYRALIRQAASDTQHLTQEISDKIQATVNSFTKNLALHDHSEWMQKAAGIGFNQASPPRWHYDEETNDVIIDAEPIPIDVPDFPERFFWPPLTEEFCFFLMHDNNYEHMTIPFDASKAVHGYNHTLGREEFEVFGHTGPAHESSPSPLPNFHWINTRNSVTGETFNSNLLTQNTALTLFGIVHLGPFVCGDALPVVPGIDDLDELAQTPLALGPQSYYRHLSDFAASRITNYDFVSAKLNPEVISDLNSRYESYDLLSNLKKRAMTALAFISDSIDPSFSTERVFDLSSDTVDPTWEADRLVEMLELESSYDGAAVVEPDDVAFRERVNALALTTVDLSCKNQDGAQAQVMHQLAKMSSWLPPIIPIDPGTPLPKWAQAQLAKNGSNIIQLDNTNADTQDNNDDDESAPPPFHMGVDEGAFMSVLNAFNTATLAADHRTGQTSHASFQMHTFQQSPPYTQYFVVSSVEYPESFEQFDADRDIAQQLQRTQDVQDSWGGFLDSADGFSQDVSFMGEMSADSTSTPSIMNQINTFANAQTPELEILGRTFLPPGQILTTQQQGKNGSLVQSIPITSFDDFPDVPDSYFDIKRVQKQTMKNIRVLQPLSERERDRTPGDRLPSESPLDAITPVFTHSTTKIDPSGNVVIETDSTTIDPDSFTSMPPSRLDIWASRAVSPLTGRFLSLPIAQKLWPQDALAPPEILEAIENDVVTRLKQKLASDIDQNADNNNNPEAVTKSTIDKELASISAGDAPVPFPASILHNMESDIKLDLANVRIEAQTARMIEALDTQTKKGLLSSIFPPAVIKALLAEGASSSNDDVDDDTEPTPQPPIVPVSAARRLVDTKLESFFDHLRRSVQRSDKNSSFQISPTERAQDTPITPAQLVAESNLTFFGQPFYQVSSALEFSSFHRQDGNIDQPESQTASSTSPPQQELYERAHEEWVRRKNISKLFPRYAIVKSALYDAGRLHEPICTLEQRFELDTTLPTDMNPVIRSRLEAMTLPSLKSYYSLKDKQIEGVAYFTPYLRDVLSPYYSHNTERQVQLVDDLKRLASHKEAMYQRYDLYKQYLWPRQYDIDTNGTKLVMLRATRRANDSRSPVPINQIDRDMLALESHQIPALVDENESSDPMRQVVDRLLEKPVSLEFPGRKTYHNPIFERFPELLEMRSLKGEIQSQTNPYLASNDPETDSLRDLAFSSPRLATMRKDVADLVHTLLLAQQQNVQHVIQESFEALTGEKITPTSPSEELTPTRRQLPFIAPADQPQPRRSALSSLYNKSSFIFSSLPPAHRRQTFDISSFTADDEMLELIPHLLANEIDPDESFGAISPTPRYSDNDDCPFPWWHESSYITPSRNKKSVQEKTLNEGIAWVEEHERQLRNELIFTPNEQLTPEAQESKREIIVDEIRNALYNLYVSAAAIRQEELEENQQQPQQHDAAAFTAPSTNNDTSQNINPPQSSGWLTPIWSLLGYSSSQPAEQSPSPSTTPPPQSLIQPTASSIVHPRDDDTLQSIAALAELVDPTIISEFSLAPFSTLFDPQIIPKHLPDVKSLTLQMRFAAILTQDQSNMSEVWLPLPRNGYCAQDLHQVLPPLDITPYSKRNNIDLRHKLSMKSTPSAKMTLSNPSALSIVAKMPFIRLNSDGYTPTDYEHEEENAVMDLYHEEGSLDRTDLEALSRATASILHRPEIFNVSRPLSHKQLAWFDAELESKFRWRQPLTLDEEVTWNMSPDDRNVYMEAKKSLIDAFGPAPASDFGWINLGLRRAIRQQEAIDSQQRVFFF